MQIPVSSMASRVLLDLGRSHLAALGHNEATRGLATAFQPSQDALVAATRAREQAEEAMSAPRVNARFAEYAIEWVLREIASLAHSADHKAGGDFVFRSVFPDGLDAEVRPRGAAQFAASTALRGRLDAQPAAAAVKALMLPQLDAALAALGSALEARRNAERTLGVARAAEDGARETFVSAYDSNAGAIRQLYPRNRVRQDLYFDQFRVQQVDDSSEPETPASAPAPAKAG